MQDFWFDPGIGRKGEKKKERLRKKKVVGSSGTRLGRQTQAELNEFENSLVYTASSGTVRAIQRPLSQKRQKEKVKVLTKIG